MKKLIQISLIFVVVFMLFQAMVGGAFILGDKMASFERAQDVTPPTSGQSTQLLICPITRLIRCAVPNVGWNS